MVVFLWQTQYVQRTAEMWVYDVAGIGKGRDYEDDRLVPSLFVALVKAKVWEVQ